MFPNRRKILRSLIAAGLPALAANSQAATLFNHGVRQLNRTARKVYMRGEPRSSDTAPSGSFAKKEVDGLLFLTNAFGFSYQIPLDSYIEWHIDNRNTYMKFRCVNSDQYRVKAFPCAVLGTMGGRWETAGQLNPVSGMENEFRMKGEGMQCPLFDMTPARTATGFPCKLGAMPATTVYAKTRYSGNPTVNTFLDLYLHDIDNPQTASHASLLGDINAINSNRTKAYNINVWFQMPDHTNGNTGRPDGAWAGGKVIGTTTIDNKDFHVILKIETGGGNYFRYIGLIPVNGPIHSISIDQIMTWAKSELRGLLEPHPEARTLMAKADPRGFPPPRWPDDNMVLSGLHLGNEIWWSDPNGQEGIVHWDTLRMDVQGVGSFGWGDATVDTGVSVSSPADSRLNGKLAADSPAQPPGALSPPADEALSLDPADAVFSEPTTNEPAAKPARKSLFDRLFGR